MCEIRHGCLSEHYKFCYVQQAYVLSLYSCSSTATTSIVKIISTKKVIQYFASFSYVASTAGCYYRANDIRNFPANFGIQLTKLINLLYYALLI